jgi:SAM-dependent methyltransferase
MPPSPRPPSDAAAPFRTGNLSADSLTFFERSWEVYHRIVADDLMEHAALVAALRSWIEPFLRRRGPAPLHLADLACGDLTTLAPLLGSLALASFTGVDASAAVLDRARERLAEAPFPCRWRHDDLLRWAEGRAESFSVVSCLFGLHHLADEDKRRFLAALPGRLEPGGVLLIADVFREPGETRPSYLQRYGRRIREQWRSLPPPLQEHVLTHINGSDFPADRDVFLTLARETGWQAEWIWHGTQQAEALLALRHPPSVPSAFPPQEQEQQPQPQPTGHTGQGVGRAAAAPPEPGR